MVLKKWVALGSMLAMLSCEGGSKNQDARPDSELMDAFSGVEFWYMDLKDRISLTEEIYKVIDARYSPIEIKGERLGTDLESMLQAALDEEMQHPDPAAGDSPEEEARINVEFIDRTKRRIAAFDDTHFEINTNIPMPRVSVGLRTQLIGGKVVVAGVSSRLKNFINGSIGATYPDLLMPGVLADQANADLLMPGVEVISIDNEPTTELLERLASYVGGSTRPFSLRQAAYDIAGRDYQYPLYSASKWKFKQPDGGDFELTLPWYIVYNNVKRRDALYYLKKRTIRFAEQIAGTFDQYMGPSQDNFTIDIGTSEIVNQLRYESKEVFYDASNSASVAHGSWAHDGKAYEVIQLRTFLPVKVKNQAGVEFETPIAAIREVVKQANTAGKNVILDLRLNGGGSPNSAAELFSLFLPAEGEFDSYTLSHRVTRQNRQMLDALNYDLLMQDYSRPSIEAMEKAVAMGEEYTIPFPAGEPIKADPAVGGFKGKLAILVDVYCISACDIAAAMFKTHGIGTLIGTHSNGTGAGYQSLTNMTGFAWSDSFEVFTSKFPNLLFGLPNSFPMTQEESTAVGNLGNVVQTNLENVPTEAGHHYEENLDHMLGSGTVDEWLTEAHQALNPGQSGETGE